MKNEQEIFDVSSSSFVLKKGVEWWDFFTKKKK